MDSIPFLSTKKSNSGAIPVYVPYSKLQGKTTLAAHKKSSGNTTSHCLITEILILFNGPSFRYAKLNLEVYFSEAHSLTASVRLAYRQETAPTRLDREA